MEEEPAASAEPASSAEHGGPPAAAAAARSVGRPKKRKRGRPQKLDGELAEPRRIRQNTAAGIEASGSRTDAGLRRKSEQLRRLNEAAANARVAVGGAAAGGAAAASSLSSSSPTDRQVVEDTSASSATRRGSTESVGRHRKKLAATAVAAAMEGLLAEHTPEEIVAGLQVVQKQNQVVQQTMQMFVDETTEGKAFAGVAAVVASDTRQLDSEGRGVAAAVTTAITTDAVTDRELARAIQRNAGVEGASISDRHMRAKLSQARKRRAPDVAEWGRTERCVHATVFLKQHSYPDSLPIRKLGLRFAAVSGCPEIRKLSTAA